MFTDCLDAATCTHAHSACTERMASGVILQSRDEHRLESSNSAEAGKKSNRANARDGGSIACFKLSCKLAIENKKNDANCRKQRLHDGVHSSTVALPHTTESRLSADIPNFDCDVAFGNFAHIKPNCRNHVFTELTRLKDKNTTFDIGADEKRVLKKTNKQNRTCISSDFAPLSNPAITISHYYESIWIAIFLCIPEGKWSKEKLSLNNEFFIARLDCVLLTLVVGSCDTSNLWLHSSYTTAAALHAPYYWEAGTLTSVNYSTKKTRQEDKEVTLAED